jgi:hypothetical protein
MPVLFAFEDCLVQCTDTTPHPSAPVHFRDVKGNLYHTANDIISDWTFQLPPELEIQRFSIVKQRSGSSAEITLRTGKRTIPCNIAGMVCSPFRQFGAGARFSGAFAVETNAAASVIRIESAVFRNVALAPLAAQYTPLPVTGTIADLQIHKAVFGGEMFAAEGCTQIVDGTVDTMLFTRIIDRFGLTTNLPDVSDPSETHVAFDGCAVHFKLQPDGIVFWGDKQWEDGKLLMYRKGDILRTQPMYVLSPHEQNPPVSYHSILSLFAPDDAPVVPLTPGLQRLVGSIPVTSAVPTQRNHPLMPAAVAPMVADPQ